jgi:NAD(P)-dependent dehydrogenase (short-subunit alcohol dehydrogenase family)
MICAIKEVSAAQSRWHKQKNKISNERLNMNTSLENKVALVTGGTSGIGKAAALALAQAGAKVVVSGRREEEGRAVELAIKKAGGNAIFVRADVSREADVKTLVDKTVATFGRLDIAFNNAGIEGQMGLTTDVQTVENFDSIFNINVKGVLLSMKHEAVAMLRNGGGSIINTSSIAGQVGFAGGGIYVASKHAVNGLSKSAALEFARKGIRVNTVSPGTIQTDMITRMVGEGETETRKWWENQHPVGRFGTVDEVAAAVVWLASPASSFVTGTDIAVDGGYMAR